MRTTRTLGRDPELTFRMFFTMLLLGGLLLAFVWIMFALGVPLLFSAVVAGGMLLLQYFLSDKLVLWSTGAKVVSPEDAPELHAMVAHVAQAADMPMPKVAIMNTDVPNAFATGRNPKKSIVAVTTGIQRRLSNQELEAVLAHEISHVKHRDILVMTMANFVAVLASFMMRMFLFSSLFGGMGNRDRNSNAGLVMLAGYMVSIVFMIIAQLLVLALSRYRELAADRGGAILTGRPLDLASALVKITGTIARIPTRDMRDLQGANALMIAGIKGGDIAHLFSTHPPVEKRIERLERMHQQMNG